MIERYFQTQGFISKEQCQLDSGKADGCSRLEFHKIVPRLIYSLRAAGMVF